MTPNWTPEDEERLRRALREEASTMLPSADGLDQIRARTRRVPFWRQPAILGVAAATGVAAVAIAAVYGVLGGPGDDTTANPGGTTSPPIPHDEATTDPTPPDAETTTPPTETESAELVTVPVYYLSDTPAGPRLAREFRAVEQRGTEAETAVATMLDEPLDAEYRTPWPSSISVRSVEIREGAIKVDLDLQGTAADEGPSDEADLAVQQLVYTVTAAMSDTGVDAPPVVRVLVDGQHVDQLWGIDLSQVVQRASQLDVRQLVQINDPTEGDTVNQPATFTGEAAVFEATFDWVIEQDGEVIEQGFDTTDEGQRFSPFAFEVDLEPGDYVITISQRDESDGEGPGVMSDSRSFTVTDD